MGVDSKMVKNLLNQMLVKQDKTNRSIKIPSILNQIDTEDSSLESSISSQIQQCQIATRQSVYKSEFPNTVGQAIGVIVVNTCINSAGTESELEYEPFDVIQDEQLTDIQKMVQEAQELFLNL